MTKLITPERIFLSRRDFLKISGTALAALLLNTSCGDGTVNYDLLTDEFGDSVTSREQIQSYGNYYEFSRSHTEMGELSKGLDTSSWQLEVGGLVKNPRTYSLADLEDFRLKEYIYRMRCLEAWSLVVPWWGFPLAKLIEAAEPSAEAKFVRFEGMYAPKQFPAQDESRYQEWLQSGFRGQIEGLGNMAPADAPYKWPYVEALRLDEAMHPLTLLATGAYKKPLPSANGAPLRLIVPWKYGFKSIKAVTKIDLVAEQPETFWNRATPEEFGFYGNVNPDVPHPRWNQAIELRLENENNGTAIATLPFNGYARDVAHLYKGMDLEKNY